MCTPRRRQYLPVIITLGFMVAAEFLVYAATVGSGNIVEGVGMMILVGGICLTAIVQMLRGKAFRGK